MKKSILSYIKYFGISQDDVEEMIINDLYGMDYDVHVVKDAGIIAIPFNNMNLEERRTTLVAHMDTICDHRTTGYASHAMTIKDGYLVLADRSKETFQSISPYVSSQYIRRASAYTSTPKTQCLGADDRSGVATIFAMLDGLKEQGREDLPIVIFCRDEEIGGNTHVLSKYIEDNFEELNTNLMIEIDTPNWSGKTFREFGFGSVTGDKKLQKYLEDFGYVKHQGAAVTDVAYLGDDLNVPSISTSASYENEHTPQERLNMKLWSQNLERLFGLYKKIQGREFPDFSYRYSGGWSYTGVGSTISQSTYDYYTQMYGDSTGVGEVLDVCDMCGDWSNDLQYFQENNYAICERCIAEFNGTEPVADTNHETKELLMEDIISVVDCYDIDEAVKDRIIASTYEILEKV